MARSLAAVAREVRGRLIGHDASFDAVSTDTRSLSQGALFVALRGPNFDGNRFVPEAQARGAAGALVSESSPLPLPQVEVADTRLALGRMASAWRDNFELPVIAITGSVGKTTVKELTASILGLGREICVTAGNLNNDIGVPLTLMGMDADDQAMVIELGANHAGEIDYLSSLVQPTVGVITNAAAAHLEGFGSLRGVAVAKGELLDHLPRAGTSVLNADDPFLGDWLARARTEYVATFGLSQQADCRPVGAIDSWAQGTRFRMRLPDATELDIELPLLGERNVVNACAAAAACLAVGVSAADIVAGLARATAVPGRMRAFRGLNAATIIDDSYNANPASVLAALDYLDALPGERILVLGDMAELGTEGPGLHAEIGAAARSRCDALLSIGDLAARAAEAYGPGAEHFETLDKLSRALQARLSPKATVLIKGSRVMGLDRLATALRASGESA